MKNWQRENLKSLEGLEEFREMILAQSLAQNNSVENKKTLLEMAKNGEPKPVAGKHPLGRCLHHYTDKNSQCHDPLFYKEIIKIRLDWFIKTAVENKKTLLKAAINKESKPNWKHPLGRCLHSYTNKNKNTYDPIFDKEIIKLRPDWFINTAVENKKKLLEMAENGKPRPEQRKHPLGNCLCYYTNKNGNTYDPIFDKEIRKLRPDWFINTAIENKKKLLEMAENGKPRPEQRKHPLGNCLCYYANKNNKSFDPVFDKEIRKLRPDWFVNCATENKKKLLEMAKNGEPKPIARKHPLGYSISNYTNKKSESYDPIFDKEIIKLRPDWFINTAIENKKKLLEMARNGEPKPMYGKHSFGRYTNKNENTYDPVFDKEIRKLRPDWFINTAIENKKKLLEMAENGEPKPVAGKHPLGYSFSNYTKTKNCHSVFDKKIRKLRPDWFIKTSDENKKKLLEMARNGEPRPKQRHSLGACLCSYTNKQNYDPIFDKKIRKLRPDWFIDTAVENKKKLLEMAKNKEPRPNKKTCLSNYTNKNGSSYDLVFDKQIRKLRPDWFKNK